jgi:hypothetical protein
VRIVVKCPDCVEMRVAPRDVTIRHCVDDGTWSYRFECPLCGRRAVSATSSEAGEDAVAAGAGLEVWRLPAELGERPASGPAISRVDLLQLHLLLQEPDWVDALVKADRDSR